ncbi:hypothetical protein [Neobacillus mesonae]|uniref:Molybdopterin cofactor biosynthesis MoaD-related C-terminal domain-containing protein n=1 Tax=Neobacillus mesonae TaxID=1193713 RepID=A0A3T0HW57_9BACI|nr:hypothetical protein [Neobacillus mesonae]AZU61217.1 hypothetical protein CHR53_08060 [Neobacillus mesonae]
MTKIELEFRGISKEYLGMYFEELGAKRITDTFPYIYEGEGWSGQLISEKEIVITSAFKVNAIQVRFFAADEAVLSELIKNYRFKTFRVGG